MAGSRVGYGGYQGPVCDFHTHLHLRLHRQDDGSWGCCPRRRDPLEPLLRGVLWRMFELMRYRYAIGRRSPLERPLERSLARILRGFPAETAPDLIARMDAAGVDRAVVLALPPIVTNEDVLACCAGHPRLIPFVSPIPPDLPEAETGPGGGDPERQVDDLLARGGRGVKIHPVFQRVRLDGKFVRRVVRRAARHRVPVVLHAGGSGRLFGIGCGFRTEPEEFADLARQVPEARLVVAHVGLWEHPQVLAAVERFPQVCLDVSFQAPSVIRRCVERVGVDRLLLGSDSPIGRVRLVLENLALAGLSADEIGRIVWHNPRRLLTATPGRTGQ